jgi:hypothetical protein
MGVPGDQKRCSKCGHIQGERCQTCGREFACGSMSEPCDREGCAELVVARRYAADCEHECVTTPESTERVCIHCGQVVRDES